MTRVRDEQPGDLEAFPPEKNREADEAPSTSRDILPLVLLGVIAGSLLVVALAEIREARVAERRECREREVARHGGNPGPELLATIAMRCGGADVLDDGGRLGFVPNVVGMPLNEAEERLRQSGYVSKPHDDDPVGADVVVWGQEPGAGCRLNGEPWSGSGRGASNPLSTSSLSHLPRKTDAGEAGRPARMSDPYAERRC